MPMAGRISLITMRQEVFELATSPNGLDSLLEPPPGMGPCRLAIVGLGWAFEHLHAPALDLFRKCGWPITITACCDIQENRRRVAQKWFPEASFFSDFNKMAEVLNGECEGLLILTNPPHTLPVLAKALSLGCPILVEKPITENPEKMKKTMEEATRMGAWVHVAYNRRFHPAFSLFQENLQALGTLHKVEAQLFRVKRNEAIFYKDTPVHPLNFLQAAFPGVCLNRFQIKGSLPPSGIPASIQCKGLADNEVPLHFYIVPSAGKAVESIRVHAEEALMVLEFTPYGLANAAALTLTSGNGSTDTLFRVDPSMSPRHGLWAQGFLGQLRHFLYAPVNGIPPCCKLEEACATLKKWHPCLAAIKKNSGEH